MKINLNSTMRWRAIKGNLYVDIRDVQLVLREAKSDSEIAKQAFGMLADAFADFETKILAENK